MITLEKLHDATLRKVEVEWKEGILRMQLKITLEDKTFAEIVASGLTSLKLPRQFPWGPSVSIREITHREIETGILISIEMQSGDVIEILAKEFVLKCS